MTCHIVYKNIMNALIHDTCEREAIASILEENERLKREIKLLEAGRDVLRKQLKATILRLNIVERED